MTARAKRSSVIAGIAISICPSRKPRADAGAVDFFTIFMREMLSDRPVFANDACGQKFNPATRVLHGIMRSALIAAKCPALAVRHLTMISMAAVRVSRYEPDMSILPRLF